MSEEYITETQQIFKNLITKPKLLSKYLLRPPFRFIHDIVMNTMKSSGFPEGLFEGNELNGKIIKEKKDKISWLNKLIKCIESVTKEPLKANPNKIVAGIEAEYTNKMLQIFGEIAIKVANGELSMQNILNNTNNIDTNSESNQNTKIDTKKSNHIEVAGFDTKKSNQNESNDNNTKKSNQSTENWITETQQTLGKLIDRPRLLPKLLKRPPFRFLHDIIKSMIKTKGYPIQFINEDKDIINADIKDAKFKHYFLSKLIAIVASTINEDLSFIDPNNIIAGKNPENTNYLLTKLAHAANAQIDVEQIKKRINKLNQNGTKKKGKQQNKTKNEEKKQKQKQNENIGKNAPRKTAPIMPKLELKQLQTNKEHREHKQHKQHKEHKEHKEEENEQKEQKEQKATQKLQRPRTARRAPPKLKSNIIEQKQNNVKNELIIMDDTEQEMDDLNDIESINDNETLGFINNVNNDNNDNNDGGDHGKLVRDILDAQSGIKLETMRLGTHRRGDSAKSIEKMENMREMIQKLCQTCLPLTKCIDLVFEDIEAINTQIIKWKQQIGKNKTQLIQEKERTNQLLSPLDEELKDIQNQIKCQNQLILEKKAVLLKNESRTNDIIRKRLLNE